MFCEECGFDMPEGATFCPVCNAPVNNQNQDNQPPKKPFKWWIPLSCVLGAVLVGGGILIGIKIANKDKNDNTTKITEEITTEEQVATPTGATTEAIEETTEEITTEEAPPERVEVALSEIPEREKLDSLFDNLKNVFYGRFDVNMDFDCESPSDNLGNIFITSENHLMVDLSNAPSYDTEFINYEDPLGKYEYGHYRVGVDGVIWCEKNIFNLSDDNINRINNNRLEREDVYELDGYYYIEYSGDFIAGFVSYSYDIINAKFDGIYYYFIVDYYSQEADVYSDGTENNSLIGRYEYKMQLKTVDGVTFWSLYNCHSLTADWAKAYYDYIEENFGEWIDNAYIFYLDDDDIPEVLVDGGAYAPAYYDLLSYQNGNIVKVENIYNGYDSSYIEKGNIFYSECETLSDKINSLYKIENGEFIEIGNEVTNLSDGSVTYTWNGQNVSEDEYNKNFSENYDSNRAIQNTTGIQDIYSWLVWQSDEYSIPEWAKAYYDYLMDEQQYNGLVSEAYIIYIDNDDIPEIFIMYMPSDVGELISYQNGNIISSGSYTHLGIDYEERANVFYAYGGMGGMTWETYYRIGNNELTEISADEYNSLVSNYDNIKDVLSGEKIDNIYGWLMGQFE